jgi:hypothetical protein
MVRRLESHYHKHGVQRTLGRSVAEASLPGLLQARHPKPTISSSSLWLKKLDEMSLTGSKEQVLPGELLQGAAPG